MRDDIRLPDLVVDAVTEIQRLDDQTVERIAAGEVVERPASVVKELVENSVDAGASRVDVVVDAGGTERIVVRDDGAGMTESAVRLAVEEHTTSKIDTVEDLEAGVGTLGFRGEALHAIGAVSHLIIRTRSRGESRGTELRVEGGEVVDVAPVGCPQGTTVSVEELFYNVPARRKYLKADATEFSHVNGVVTGYALANPEIAVSLTHGDRETFATAGRGDLRSAVLSVYGREVAESMVPVEDDLPDGPLDAIEGLISHPETNRASREYVSTFVNRRYVTATAVREAIVEAYGRQLAADRYPFAVVSLVVDPGTVDVNVHPRKLEVRFADEEGMQRQVREAVETTLLDEGLVRTSAPRGRSKAEQTEIVPGRNDVEGDTDGDGVVGTDTVDTVANDERKASETAGETSGSGTETETIQSNATMPDRGSTSAPTESGPSIQADTDYYAQSSTPISNASDDESQDRSQPTTTRKFRHRPAQTTFDGSDPTAHEFATLPSMRVLGQLHDTYVVGESGDGLVLVDQHAADERVQYERLRERFSGDVTTQALANPVDLELTSKEAALADAAREVLARLGFHTSLIDERTLRVSTVPSLLADRSGPELVRDLLSDFAGGEADRTVEQAADELLGDLACYPAITAGESLTEGSVTDLLRALDDCENPYACPHGRPVIVELGTTDIEERFERDYPGHLE